MGASQSRATTVVIADDEAHVRSYLELVLQDEGFVVVGTAKDADTAVSLVSREQPDVVLLDLHMPGGGLTAARLIGSICPATRIVVFSAEAPEPEILPLLQAGIDGYVLKGCSPEQLADALRAAVAGDKLLTPSVGRIAVEALISRLHAEQQVAVGLARQRARIEDVIARQRFEIAQQPIVDLATRLAVGVEALARFTALPRRPPDEWFAEAEAVHLRVPPELAAAAAAVADLALIPEGVDLFLNVSPTTVVSGRLGEVLRAAPLDRVVLELTEHAPVEDYRALRAAIAPWRERGARLAVDDAGGGYASFSHILQLQPEFIKLDISIARDIHLDQQRQALARALVGFAAELGVGAIAEGIETQAELDAMVELGLPYGQGFHLGRPRPLHEQLHQLRPVTDLDAAAREPATESVRRT